MQIANVYAKDFLTIGELIVNIKDAGLVLLQGSNKDDSAALSNGSGKSSFAEIACFALYGSTARGSSGDAVIREGTKLAHCTVDLIDENSSESWLVSRIRKKGKTLLTVSGNGIDLTLGTEKLTQELINKIVGCNEDVFRASVYMGQEQLIDLPRMTDRHLKNIVEEAAGVVVLEKAYEAARGRLNVAKTELNDTNNVRFAAQVRLDTKQTQLEREKELVEVWEEDKRYSINKISVEERARTSEWHSFNAALNPALENELKQKIEQFKAELESYEPARREEAALANAANEAQRPVLIKSNKIRDLIGSIKELKAEKENVTDKIGQPCPECGTPMTEDHLHAAKQQVGRKLAKAALQMTAERDEHSKAAEVAKNAKDSLEAHRASMRDPSKLANELLKAERALGVEEGKHKALALIEADMKKMQDQIKALEGKINPHTAEVEKVSEQVTLAKIEVDKLDGLLNEKRDQITLMEQAAEVFGPSGVRAHILDTVTPYLNARTSEYLSMLSDGAIQATWNTLVRNSKGELREKFSIEVTHEKGGRGFNELSGGERRKVRLSCAFALQDLVASRASKPFRANFLDEIDDALDEAGLERLAMVLQAKADVTGTVVVISHNDLKSHISKVWTMVKEGGASSLVVE